MLYSCYYVVLIVSYFVLMLFLFVYDVY